MPRRRRLRSYLMEAKYETLRMLRTPGFAGPFLILPAGLYLLFAVVLFGADIAKDPKAGLFTFMGFATFGVMGPGMFGFGATVAMEREQGLWRLKRAMPVPPAAPLLAKMCMAALFVAIVTFTMIAAAPLGHVRMSGSQFMALSIVNILGALPFCALGLLIGSLATGKGAIALVNAVYLVMTYLSAILIPMPQSIRWIALLSPAYHLEQVAYRAIGAPSEGVLAVHFIVLLGITLVCAWAAIRRLARVG
jgi:ABC-2 type transport system permease protein